MSWTPIKKRPYDGYDDADDENQNSKTYTVFPSIKNITFVVN
jgi:hypothetical protein